MEKHGDTKTPRKHQDTEAPGKHQGTEAPRTQREPLPEEVNALARLVVEAAFRVHSTLGPGLLESVYEACLGYELEKAGKPTERQIHLPVRYDNMRLHASLRLDLVVEHAIVIDVKAVESILPVHIAQMLTYLKLTGLRLGFVINFNVPLIREGIRRIIL